MLFIRFPDEDEVDVPEYVGVSRIRSATVIDPAAQLGDGGPDLDVQHAAFVQKQHLPSAP